LYKISFVASLRVLLAKLLASLEMVVRLLCNRQQSLLRRMQSYVLQTTANNANVNSSDNI
jgi:hypothetical protein